MTLDSALTVVITGLVYVCVSLLLVAIVVANAYALLHAWRSNRSFWVVVLSVLLVTGVGGGIATAVYLILYHDEPLPRVAASKPRAVA